MKTHGIHDGRRINHSETLVRSFLAGNHNESLVRGGRLTWSYPVSADTSA